MIAQAISEWVPSDALLTHFDSDIQALDLPVNRCRYVRARLCNVFVKHTSKKARTTLLPESHTGKYPTAVLWNHSNDVFVSLEWAKAIEAWIAESPDRFDFEARIEDQLSNERTTKPHSIGFQPHRLGKRSRSNPGLGATLSSVAQPHTWSSALSRAPPATG